MAWDHLSITKPHLVYIILGGFTSLFMLCSSVIKERLYIGEATVATICGIIFGPHAANLINPMTWGNTDLITVEFARIVLVVQCFAVGVELPKNYMEKHWRSVTFLLVPVMTYGWLVTSLFIWWMFGNKLNWLDSLCIAACVTATDPVLASSVVGKGKFAKRVPKHLRDLLSAESGCNDGMAFPFIYFAIYMIRYRPDADKFSLHWFCFTILYECIFGAFFGVVVGYLARRAIRYAHEKDLIDRESFLVFYFVLALFCAGAGSLLGMDDLLVGFACGVGFSNDGWFQEKTEESHVSNVIDLLINLAFFVYFGTIVPWEQYNSSVLGIQPWRLVVVGLFVLFFRRIPIMLALKPIIPDLKTWREASFAGHFGPIGVGAIFVAILARAELETEETTPLAVIPEEGFPHLNIIELIWPITTFLVIVSIIVHGSSIAVFTLGRHINTLSISVSFTKGPDEGPSWMERLPRIQSRSKSSMAAESDSSFDEKLEAGTLDPKNMPKGFLRRLRDDDKGEKRSSSVKASRRRKKWDAGIGPGGPVSESAIKPAPRLAHDNADRPDNSHSESDTLVVNDSESPDGGKLRTVEPEEEVYREGSEDIIEDEEGNVLEVRKSKPGESEQERDRQVMEDGRRLMKEEDVEHGVAQTKHELDDKLAGNKIAKEMKAAAQAAETAVSGAAPGWRELTKKYSGVQTISALRKKDEALKPEKKHGPALAYQFGNTIIVEDEDGEVIKKYDIPAQPRPAADRKTSFLDPSTRRGLERMGTWVGLKSDKPAETQTEAGPSKEEGPIQNKGSPNGNNDDDNIRFTVGTGGRRMSKADFIKAVARLDPKSRQRMIDEADAPEGFKREASMAVQSEASTPRQKPRPEVQRLPTAEDRPKGPEGLTLVDSNEDDIPFHPISDTLAKFNLSGGSGGGETAAQRRRRQAQEHIPEEDEANSGGSPRGRPRGDTQTSTSPSSRPAPKPGQSFVDEPETAAERRRRLAALGGGDDDSSSEEEGEGGSGLRDLTQVRSAQQAPKKPEQAYQRGGPSIRFAEASRPQEPTPSPAQESSAAQQEQGKSNSMRLRWGANVGRKPGGDKK